MWTVKDNKKAPLFFEEMTIRKKSGKTCYFPKYIQDIITYVSNRKYIYMPGVFAEQLRKTYDKEPLHDTVFIYFMMLWQRL
jgi:hypothetical protein